MTALIDEFKTHSTNQDAIALVSLFTPNTLDQFYDAVEYDVAIHITKEALFNKRSISDGLRLLREACQECVENFHAQARQLESALEKKEEIQRTLGIDFGHKELLWKHIDRLSTSKQCGRVQFVIRRYARSVGLFMNDYTPVKTGLWTKEALDNLVAGSDKTKNTDEHYSSLYANAGYTMFEEAIAKGMKYDIDVFAASVYANIQTVRSTRTQNDALADYHKKHEQKSAEQSYIDVGLIIPEEKPLILVSAKKQLVKLAWELALEEWGVDHEKIRPPFKHTITLDEAIERWPEFQAVKTKLKIKR